MAHDVHLRDHVSDLHEAMKVEMTRQIAELRDAMNRKVDEIRLEAIHRSLLVTSTNEEALKFVAEFEQEVRGRIDTKDAELKEAFNEISLLTAQLADVEDQLSEQDTYDPGDAYPTMSATVQLLRRHLLKRAGGGGRRSAKIVPTVCIAQTSGRAQVPAFACENMP